MSDNLTSPGFSPGTTIDFEFEGRHFHPVKISSNCSGLVSPSTRHVVGRVSSGIPTDDTFPSDPAAFEALAAEKSVLLELVTAQADEIARLSAKVVELTGRLADLEQRIGRNPRNSSMPPSKEGLGKPNRLARSERKAAGRRKESNPVPRANLAQVLDPMRSSSTRRLRARTAGRTCQVPRWWDRSTPGLRHAGGHAVVTEHRIERRRCSCGCETKAEVPAFASAPCCYGPRSGARLLPGGPPAPPLRPHDTALSRRARHRRVDRALATWFKRQEVASALLGHYARAAARRPAVNFDETGSGRRAGCTGCTTPPMTC